MSMSTAKSPSNTPLPSGRSTSRGGWPGGALLLALGGLLAAGGCVYPVRGDLGGRWAERLVGERDPDTVTDPPRLRVGSMPFDAWYSPLQPLARTDLTPHRYRRGLFPGPAGSTNRGILYTRRGGFLDIAHLRNAVDLTRYVYLPLRDALARGAPELRLMSAEPDVFVVSLANGTELSDDQLHAVAAGVAARVAYLMTTWHEVATWHGYKATGLFTERPSAFSYDDAASHMVGVLAATDALEALHRAGRAADDDAFSDAATRAIDRRLAALAAVSAREVERRVRMVDGRWHDADLPVLRVVHMGLPGERLWARTLDEDEPAVWVLPADASVAGRSLDRWAQTRIEMRLFERRAVAAAAGRPDADGDWTLDPLRDFPRLRSAMVAARQP